MNSTTTCLNTAADGLHPDADSNVHGQEQEHLEEGQHMNHTKQREAWKTNEK